ncbi:MAG: DUF4058 family protein [Planctomycetaceae bacterium]|nr:DUF4058 family protein [Planctomycetaceae bacterium]
MPSIFPGIDPFIEDQEWEDFHSTFNTVLRETLAPGLEPRYVVRVERRVYVEHGLGDEEQVRWADVSVLWSGSDAPVAVAPTAAGTALQPVECLLPAPQERRETYLVIRDVPAMEIVTVIETLSPANKRASSDGRGQYLAKRDEILQSRTNLVELDLLRGGKRLPVVGMPPGDYYAIVSRGYRRPKADVFAWTLRQALPVIPVPLKKGEAEPLVDLQQVFTTVFDRARYQLSLNYSAALNTSLVDADEKWLRELVAKRN